MNTLLAEESDQGSKLTLACKYLDELLGTRDMPSTEVNHKMSRMDIGKRTVAAAKQKLQIVSYRKNNVWYWKLPARSDTELLTAGNKADE